MEEANQPESLTLPDPALDIPDIVPALEVPEIISYNTVEGLPLETLIVLLGQFTGCLWSGNLTQSGLPWR